MLHDEAYYVDHICHNQKKYERIVSKYVKRYVYSDVVNGLIGLVIWMPSGASTYRTELCGTGDH